MFLTCTSPLIAIALQKGTSIVYPILWRRQIQLCLNTVRRVDCHLSQESLPTSSPWLATLGRDNVKPNNRFFFPASALWPVWPGQSTVSVGRKLYRSI